MFFKTVWCKNNRKGVYKVFTGGGKSLIALASYLRTKTLHPELKLVIVVPKIALANQWKECIVKYTDIKAETIGLMGGGNHDSLLSHSILICVIDSACKKVPRQSKLVNNKIMLIVDECHRAGSDVFSKIFKSSCGLSVLERGR